MSLEEAWTLLHERWIESKGQGLHLVAEQLTNLGIYLKDQEGRKRPERGPAIDFNIRKMKLDDGKEVELRETDDGRWVCPVCGYLLPGVPAYDGAKRDDAGFEAIAPPVLCPSCDTEFGVDDISITRRVGTLVEAWVILRAQWIESKAGMVHSVVERLKNLDIFLPEEERRRRLG